MPKKGQSIRIVQAVEDCSALATAARERLAWVTQMLESEHRIGRLSEFNLTTAREDIAVASAIISHLQKQLGEFRNTERTQEP